jgi:hypothetical protein
MLVSHLRISGTNAERQYYGWYGFKTSRCKSVLTIGIQIIGMVTFWCKVVVKLSFLSKNDIGIGCTKFSFTGGKPNDGFGDGGSGRKPWLWTGDSERSQ